MKFINENDVLQLAIDRGLINPTVVVRKIGWGAKSYVGIVLEHGAIDSRKRIEFSSSPEEQTVIGKIG